MKFLDGLKVAGVCNAKEQYCIIDISCERPGIFVIDKATMESGFLGFIDRAKGKSIKVSCAAYYEDIGLFGLWLDKEELLFVFFSLTENRIWYFDNFGEEMDITYMNCSFIQVKNKIWYFPVRKDRKIVIFDVLSQQYETVDIWGKPINKIGFDELEFSTFGKPIYVNGKIYVSLTRTNCVMEIDTGMYEVRMHELPEMYELAFPMAYDGGSFWLLQARNKGIVCWNPQRGVLKRIIFPEYRNPKTEKWHAWYREIFIGTEYLWVIIACDDRVLRIRKQNSQCELIAMNFEGKEDDEQANHFLTRESIALYEQDERKAFIFKGLQEIWRIDLIRDQVDNIADRMPFPKRWTYKEIMDYWGKEKVKQVLLKDDDLLGLLDFLKYENSTDLCEER